MTPGTGEGKVDHEDRSVGRSSVDLWGPGERQSIVIVQSASATDQSIPAGLRGWLDDHPRFTLLRATGRPLEVSYPFGVAISLLDGLWSDGEHALLFAGPGQVAGELIGGELRLEPASRPADAFDIVRSLTAVVRALARQARDGQAVVIWVDGLEHADGPSLRFLAYLASRMDASPIALVLRGDLDATMSDPEAVAALRRLADEPNAPPPPPEPSARPQPDSAEPDCPAPWAADGSELAQRAARAGRSDMSGPEVRELARQAWSDAAARAHLLAEPAMIEHLLWGLLAVDELELAQEIIADRRFTRNEPTAPRRTGLVAELRGWALFHQGRIAAASDEAERGLAHDRGPAAGHGLSALLAACLIHRGDLARAETLLEALDGHEPHPPRVLSCLLTARGLLRLAQRLPNDAHRDAMEERRRSSRSDAESAGPVSWRVIAARADIFLQRLDHAGEVATRELELAEARSIPRRSIAALRTLAAASSGQAQVDLLQQAVTTGDRGPERLEHLWAIIDLGSALRRTNQRRAARGVLERALALAEDRGAEGAAERSREELAAAGRRRSQVAGTGIASLTPSERRVAGLAAAGLSTREIAAQLFITPKTVEFHLHHIYRKLEIPSSREELGRLFEDEAPAPAPGGDAPGAGRGAV